MNRLTLLIAWRYLYRRHHECGISWMVAICFLGICIGTFALATIIAIMNGFEKETYKKLQGIHSSLSIDAYGQQLEWNAIKKVLKTKFPHLCGYTPVTSKQAIIQLPESDDISNVISLRAIEPSSQQGVTSLKETIKDSLKKDALASTINSNQLLIGASLAETLGLVPGDVANILFIPEDENPTGTLKFDQKKVTIGSTFKTGIDEFDSHVAYCSFEVLEQLFPESGVTQIDIRLPENANEAEIVKQLKDTLHLNAYTWQEQYPALISAFKLEKYAMLLILGLIILIASMNVMSLLITQITQKRCDVAILKALGMPNSEIRAIFLIMGTIISLFASLAGLLLALLFCFFIEHYPCIKLPDAYYTTHLPVSIECYNFVIIFVSVIIISFISIWFATAKATNITIASVLRFEL